MDALPYCTAFSKKLKIFEILKTTNVITPNATIIKINQE